MAEVPEEAALEQYKEAEEAHTEADASPSDSEAEAREVFDSLDLDTDGKVTLYTCRILNGI